MSRPTFWPDAHQTLLLHAVLDEPEIARPAMLQWLATIDFETIDLASQRLMPLLHERLKQLGIAHPLDARIKGIFRRNWYLDQRLRRQLRIVRDALAVAGVDNILLKGAALGRDAYTHGAFRPADDIDLLVRAEDFDRAAALFVEIGLCPQKELSPSRHARSFQSDIGSVDLHVSPFRETVEHPAIEGLWADKRQVTIDGSPANLLSMHDQLLHTLTHGMFLNPVPPIRWIADATTCIRRYGAKLEWKRFAARAESLGFTLVTHRGLSYLAGEFGVCVPADLLTRLEAQPKRLSERIEYHCGRSDRFQLLAVWARTYRDARHVNPLTRSRMVADVYRQSWRSSGVNGFALRVALRLMLGRRLTDRLYSKS